MILNEIFEKALLKTLWIWLPFRAFWRLSKEIKNKYYK
jgi:hypothetical protein